MRPAISRDNFHIFFVCVFNRVIKLELMRKVRLSHTPLDDDDGGIMRASFHHRTPSQFSKLPVAGVNEGENEKFRVRWENCSRAAAASERARGFNKRSEHC
jgi:hypothetical protein